MRTRIAFLLIGVFVFTTGQDSMPAQAPQDVEPTAVAFIHLDKHSFKSGEVIKLTILLEAGPGGAYIPKSWGEMGGGIPGFSVHLTTLSGRGAETCGMAADALPQHESNATVVLNRDLSISQPNTSSV